MIDLTTAANHLADTLAEENTALTKLDLRRAVGLLGDKQCAIEAFTAALAASNATSVGEPLAQRLRALTGENKLLLERAIAAQGRVIAVIARAMQPPGYGGLHGRYAAGRPVPFALAAQA